MRAGRDKTSFRQNVMNGAALGIGAALGAAAVAIFVELIAPHLPFVVKVLPKGSSTP